MSAELARVGRAIGSPARATMIDVLFDGAPHSAGELAAAAGVASGTASQHLTHLVDAGIVTVEQTGRHRLYQLANARIARALELLSGPEQTQVTSLRLSREQRRLRAARTCYDHLAGQLGVAVATRFVTAGWVDPTLTTITPAGHTALNTHFGVAHPDWVPPRSGRATVRACHDWTEQQNHLAGALGALLAATALSHQWVVRRPGSRGLTITEQGRVGFTAAGVRLT